MNAEIEAHLPEIKELCERYGVIKLELFGSATRPDFDPETSDFDFIATYEVGEAREYPGWRYIAFPEELEDALKRSVDVLTPGAIKNPYFAAAVNETRTTIVESKQALATHGPR